MLSANFKPKQELRHRAVPLRQHGFLVSVRITVKVYLVTVFFHFQLLLHLTVDLNNTGLRQHNTSSQVMLADIFKSIYLEKYADASLTLE